MIIQKNKLVWNSKPYIMGVVNVTPDSFSGDGIMKNNEDFVNLGVEKALGMQKDGADIIDVGGESTRPKHIYQGAQSISVDEELERVLPLLEKLKKFKNCDLSFISIRRVCIYSTLSITKPHRHRW